jgi:hypothetical protein
MLAAMNDAITIVHQRGTLSAAEVAEEVARILEEEQAPPDSLAAVNPESAGFDPASIALVAAGVVARDLWKEVVLPRIKKRWGPDAVGPEVKDGG